MMQDDYEAIALTGTTKMEKSNKKDSPSYDDLVIDWHCPIYVVCELYHIHSNCIQYSSDADAPYELHAYGLPIY
jgi:hypothetical protein